jgi:hypothetical protein
LRKSWDGAVQAERIGAIAGLRKPTSVGAVVSAVERSVAQSG